MAHFCHQNSLHREGGTSFLGALGQRLPVEFHDSQAIVVRALPPSIDRCRALRCQHSPRSLVVLGPSEAVAGPPEAKWALRLELGLGPSRGPSETVVEVLRGQRGPWSPVEPSAVVMRALRGRYRAPGDIGRPQKLVVLIGHLHRSTT